jgi:hypothetical protein
MTDNARDAFNEWGYSCQPDCTVMDRDHINRDPKLESQLNSSLAEFFIEFKHQKCDPFGASDEPAPNDTSLYPDDLLMEMVEGPVSKVAGQITAYATLLLGNQYRTHTFLVLIVKDFARLLRWDRGGAVVTDRFYYDEDPYLFQFLVRYNYAGRDMRGHDDTVRNPTEDELRAARATVDELKNPTLVTMVINDRRYVIRAPCARPEIPVGRWTRTSIAYDCQSKKRVFMKDSWRVELPDVYPESEIYGRLQQAEVPYVPRCIDGGDIGGNAYHRTRSHEFMNYTLDPASKKITRYRHHRLVLDTVGRKLHRFKCSKEMVRAIHVSLIGKYILSYRRVTVFDARYSSPSCLQGWYSSPRHQRRKYNDCRGSSGYQLWNAH